MPARLLGVPQHLARYCFWVCCRCAGRSHFEPHPTAQLQHLGQAVCNMFAAAGPQVRSGWQKAHCTMLPSSLDRPAVPVGASNRVFFLGPGSRPSSGCVLCTYLGLSAMSPAYSPQNPCDILRPSCMTVAPGLLVLPMGCCKDKWLRVMV